MSASTTTERMEPEPRFTDAQIREAVEAVRAQRIGQILIHVPPHGGRRAAAIAQTRNAFDDLLAHLGLSR